jgi:hypothetical protein
MKRSLIFGLVLCSCFLIAATDPECENTDSGKANSGVTQVAIGVTAQSNGRTIEQDNVAKRLQLENKPGGIMHLYILSAYSGQVLLYSTVKGKVTSSGKRLSPSSHSYAGSYNVEYNPELLGDDGTYGSSVDYLYWWDVKGIYHQQYVSGGMMVHIADQPMQFGRVTMQVESMNGKD